MKHWNELPSEASEPDEMPDITSSRFEELTTALEDTQDLIDSMQSAEHNRKQSQKARLLATREKYQNSMNIVAQTMGQIALLREQLTAQETDRRRLEGIVEYLQSIPD